MSVNSLTKEMRFVASKFLSDGSKLEKIQSFSEGGISSGFFRNGVRVADIIERLNLSYDQNDQDWLSLKPEGANRF